MAKDIGVEITEQPPKKKIKKVSGTNNTSKKEAEEIVDLGFKVPVEVRTGFNTVAASNNLSGKALFLEAIDLVYKKYS